MSDIVEKLRSYRPYRIGNGEWFGPKVCEEAAETILALRKEVEAAEAAQLNLVRRGTHFRNAGIRQAAALVEELSKRPSTKWGEVKASIIALQDTALSDDDEHPGWVYAIQYGPEGESDYAWVYDETGRMIATMRTHDAARLAKPRAALATEAE